MKSYENDLLSMMESIMFDAFQKCSVDVNYVRDLDVLRARTENEGLSFLTITLPDFASDFDRALSKGAIDSSLFRSFKKCAGLPAFLQGFLSLVFEPNTRRLLDDPDIAAIEGIRQIGNAFKKIKLNCTESRRQKAFKSFIQSERVFDDGIDVDDYDTFINVSKRIWSDVWFNLDYDLIPRHGPGATAEKFRSLNEKMVSKRWHERLEPYFPSSDFIIPNWNYIDGDFWKQVEIVPEKDEQPVRVIDVPKTLKTRRIIAIEPCCMQYSQQALARVIIDRLEKHPLTKGHINFSDQSINREQAKQGSISGRKATIDESSASDRVPKDPAIRMFDSNPDLRDAILACRSTRADVNGLIIDLKKFASMGSALCFPVEAMYFFTICVIALLKHRNLECTTPNIYDVSRHIYVYGDDLIVPTEAADLVMTTLTKYYCKVNTQKSFFEGNFRESCGLDAFKGEVVTPIYVRQPFPHDKREASACISLVETCNLFYKKGYWRTADHIRRKLEVILFKLPVLPDASEGLGLTSFQSVLPKGRFWNKKYQRPESKAWVIRPRKRKDPLNGETALLKCLLRLESRKTPVQWIGHFTKKGQVQDFCTRIQTPDREHLESSVRRGAVTLTRRKVGTTC